MKYNCEIFMFILLVIYNALTPTFIIVAFIEYCG
jgi:hypothetical protein